MKCRTRMHYSAAQKALMWERWKDPWYRAAAYGSGHITGSAESAHSGRARLYRAALVADREVVRRPGGHSY